MRAARGHDGAEIPFVVVGDGPAVLVLNAFPSTPDAPAAPDESQLAEALQSAIADRFRLVFVRYPGRAKPHTLTPRVVTRDLLAVADATGCDQFAYWGYSWGGVVGLQLALGTDRLTALAMSGFPPIDGPYAAMLALCREVLRDRQSEKTTPDEQAAARQFVTYYEGLQCFDDRAAVGTLTIPRLCFVGADDVVSYADAAASPIGATVARRREELERLGWEVRIVDGRDHETCLHPDVVVPLLTDWLDRVSSSLSCYRRGRS